MQKQKEEHEKKEMMSMSENEHCFSQYVKSLDNYDEELTKVVGEKDKLGKQIKLLKVEKKAKLKFLATSLLYATV
jgi:hypothetical protein